MEEFCQNSLCENKAVKEVPISQESPGDQVRSLCTACEEVYTWGVQHGGRIDHGLKVDHPGEEMGPEPLYTVVYTIDVNAANVREAAEYVHSIMTDPDSMRPVLHVIDSKGGCTTVDLSEEDTNPDNRVETANYEAAAQYLADQGDRIFTGPMNGGLWNGRCMDAVIMSRKQDDKVAYEFLIKFGDQYASSLSADQHRQWQIIKDQAAGLLKDSRENTSEI